MTRPLCTNPECDRPVVRYREGAGYCLFHPDGEPPVLDPKTGKPVAATPPKRAKRKREIPPQYRAPGRVVEAVPLPDDDDMADLQEELDELERTDPAVAAAAASYDAAVARVLAHPHDDVELLEEVEGDREDVPRARPAGDGARAVERPRSEERSDQAPRREPDRPALPRPAAAQAVAQEATAPDADLMTLQLALRVVERIVAAAPPKGAEAAHAQMVEQGLRSLVQMRTPDLAVTAEPAARTTSPRRRGAPVDEEEAVRRYTEGAGLFELAAELHIGANRLRAILRQYDVPIRGRGQVVGQRGAGARPFDVDEAVRLYEGGLDSAQVARQLGVSGVRVQDALRDRGVLRRPLTEARPFDENRARALYAEGWTLEQLRREFGVRTSRIADLLRANGELRPKGRRPKCEVGAA
jgi:hypothetical protein